MRTLALLPGSYTEAADFERQGFLAAAAARCPQDAVWPVELRATWFADGSAVDRIRATVVEPARAEGRGPVWLCGISLGALAAMAYAARREKDLAGMVLMSPYPGTRDVLREIDAAGGLEEWRPSIPAEGDLEREAWQWLASRPGTRLPVHCYFGSEDRFAASQRRIGEQLDARCVHELPGGHDWPAWRRFWDAFLARDAAVPA